MCPWSPEVSVPGAGIHWKLEAQKLSQSQLSFLVCKWLCFRASWFIYREISSLASGSKALAVWLQASQMLRALTWDEGRWCLYRKPIDGVKIWREICALVLWWWWGVGNLLPCVHLGTGVGEVKDGEGHVISLSSGDLSIWKVKF